MNLKLNHTITHFLILSLVTLAARVHSEIIAYGADYLNIFAWELRGTLSDSVVCFLVALLLGKLKRRYIQYGIYFLWAGFLAGNLSHVEANYANIDFMNIGFMLQGEFVEGSILSWEFLSRWAAYLSAIIMLQYLFLKYATQHNVKRRRYLYAGAAMGMTLLAFVPGNGEYWRQYNLFEENIRNVSFFSSKKGGAAPHKVLAAYQRITALDLNGKRIIKDPSVKRPNILIITIEGLSDYYISRGVMPYLESLTKQLAYYPNFINMQQYTYNGLYAILCGDHSTLNSRRMNNRPRNKWFATARFGPREPCLPDALNALGYHTVFFQASGLHFTQKKKFFQKVGFTQAYSAYTLGQERPEGHTMLRRLGIMGWGMSDKNFFNAVSNKLVDYSKTGHTPWFATMMTTGTHWPFRVKPSYAKRFGSKRRAAFYTADRALKSMMETLEKKGVLDNTLVFITGDEMHLRRDRKNKYNTMASNWGLLVVRTPNKDRYTSREYFMQADIKASIYDYMNVSNLQARYRSVFREYNRFRPLMFSAHHAKRWLALPEPGRYIKCKSDFTRCKSRYFKGELFEAKALEMASDRDTSLYVDVARKIDNFLPKQAFVKKKKKRYRRKKKQSD